MKTTGSLFVACALALACKSRPAADPGRRPATSQSPTADRPPPPSAAMQANPFAGADTAVRAAMGPSGASANLRAPTQLDLDGDGSTEGLYNDESYGCYVAVRNGDAWAVRQLVVQAGNNDDGVRCAEPLRVGTRTLLVAKGGGQVRNTDTPSVASSSVGATVWSVVGGEVRALWSDEVADAQNDDDFTFTALGDRGVAVARKEHGVTTYRALLITATGELDARTCWGPTAPTEVPEAPAGCNGRPARGDRMFATEAATVGDVVDLTDANLVSVLHAGTARRGPARAYCVVSTNGERTGYMYLRPAQLTGCPSLPLSGEAR